MVEKEEDGSKRARVEESESAKESDSTKDSESAKESNIAKENGIAAVKEGASVNSQSLLNHFFLAVQRSFAFAAGTNSEAACQLLGCLIDVASAQCKMVFHEPVSFMVGAKGQEGRSRVVTVSQFQLLVIDLLQLFCSRMRRRGCVA